MQSSEHDTSSAGQGTRASARFGVARRDVTPPEGIFFRNWGAGNRDVAAGVHRPFTATALTIRQSPDHDPVVLVAVDGGWWQAGEDEWFVRQGLVEDLGLDLAHVMINLSHTHAGPSLVTENEDRPGGEHILPYLEAMRTKIVDAVREALAGEQQGDLHWAGGCCDLATNRSLWDSEGERYVTGYNPSGPADDTLVVGRITDGQGRFMATVVNYACHPTTLAWDNELLSPDYIGAMREEIEAATDGAPCLFLLGACGELAPALQYEGDVAIADRHGRRLGLAARSSLEGMLAPGNDLVFDRIVESGAPLGVWRSKRVQAPAGVVSATRLELSLKVKEEYPQLNAILSELERAKEPFMRERLSRKARLRRTLGDTDHYTMSVWIWKVGDAFFVGHPGEAFSSLQQELRKAFPECTVVVMNVVNGTIGYLPPTDLYDEDMYEVWQTPLDRGCLETLQDACAEAMRKMLASPPSPSISKGTIQP